MHHKFKKSAAIVLAMSAALSGAASAQDIVRHDMDNFPIASAVEVPAGRTTVYLSGKVPGVTNANAPKDSLESYGDTKAQTINVLTQIQQQLESLGLDMRDVVKMQAFLVGGPENGGKMDFAGFMQGYTQFFGDSAKQPNLPARSAFQVAGLLHPAWRIEIEVVAVRR